MKSNCCHSNLHIQENGQHICTNDKCENYLASVDFLYKERIWNNLFALFFFIFIFLFTFNDYSFNKNAIGNSADALLKMRQNQPLTDESLKNELKEQEIVCREAVFAQIQIESGHMKSFLFQKTNNFFGMRYPCKRSTQAIGMYLPDSDTIIYGSQKDLKKYASKNNYAVYACWQDCVKDYKFWQIQCFNLTEKYLAFLGTYYAEDAAYVTKIKGMIK
jgi:hypothetical protein